MATIQFVEEIVFTTITCCECGLPFCITQEYKNRIIRDGKTFHCPNGHPQWFGEGKVAKLEKELAKRTSELDQKQAEINSLRFQKSTLEKSVSDQKGITTKLRNRAKHGVCPCCNRTFKQLAAHMKNKHPDFKVEDE